MKTAIRTLRRVLGIAVAWAILWGAFWAIVGLIIRVVDPDSIDPGEGTMMVVILGSMGLLTGVAFGMLLSIGARGRTTLDHSLTRAVGCGILGSAIVQLAYLDHGDLGLAANIKMALLFCAFGVVITMTWLLIARRWSHWRSSPRSPS